MKLVNIGAAALNQTPLDWRRNKENIIGAIRDARAKKVDVLCLPELSVCGYGCEDAFFGMGVVERSMAMLLDILPETKGMVVGVGTPLRHAKHLYNGAALCVDGRLVGVYCKQFLAGSGVYYEPRWFRAWTAGVKENFSFRLNDGRTVECPIGDLFFDCKGVRIGFEICEDAWVADRPGTELAKKGADIILNPSASHFAFGKMQVRRNLCEEGSRSFGVAYAYANLLGNESGRLIFDGGAMIASGGKVCGEGRRLSFSPFDLAVATVDLDENTTTGANFRDDPTDDPQSIAVGYEISPREEGVAASNRADWDSLHPNENLKYEEFTRAVSLGLLDYLQKSRSQGFVVSISGGADSAAVAVLCRSAIELAAREVSLKELFPRNNFTHIDELAGQLITCAYLGTENSSSVTLNAARSVAEGIAAEFHVFDAQPLVNQYTEQIREVWPTPVQWETEDLALQNIQARARGPFVWFLANLKRALLLATSNRSEAAVGYATMDGDTCGGLSPIGGIDKEFLRQWLVWMEKEGPRGGAPCPWLAPVNAQAPTAELRPSSEKQTDEDDLMPYDVLEAIEDAAIRDKRTPVDVYRTLRSRYDDPRLKAWVRRFFQLWCRNQWKRERYAPSFHLDDRNLDPKTWCRFPILSGGFEEELARLDAMK